MKKLTSVLLIDDDMSVNFINQRILQLSDAVENIVVHQSATEGLAYLSDLKGQEKVIPDVIFLDLNMPVMDGWQFLECYIDLPSMIIDKTKLFILSTSKNPDDRTRANSIPVVSDYITKPLSVAKIESILARYF